MNISDVVDGTLKHHHKTAAEMLREQMERYLAPIHQVQEMQALLRPQLPEHHMLKALEQNDERRRVQEMLDRVSPSKYLKDMLGENSVISQVRKLAEQFSSTNLLGLNDVALRKLSGLNSVADAMKEHEQYLNPVIQQQEWINKLQQQALGSSSIQAIARQIEQANPALAAMADARRTLDGLWTQFRDVDLSNLEIGEGEEQEAELVVQAIGTATVADATIKDAVERIVTTIQLQQNPVVQLMLWVFFRKVMDWLIAGAIGAAMGHYAPAVLGEQPQAAKKAIKETAREVAGAPYLLSDYRYVSAKVLVVRQNPRARSPEIGRLQFGKPVKVIQKSNDFSLVLWTDRESGVEIQGWVFSRYLGKFN